MGTIKTRLCVDSKKHYDDIIPVNSTLFYPEGSLIAHLDDQAFRVTGAPLFEWFGNACVISYPVEEITVKSLSPTLTRTPRD